MGRKITSAILWFRHGKDVERSFIRINIRKYGGPKIPTYVRNDNSDEVYQSDSANTANSEKRLNVFLESNMGGIRTNEWSGVG